MAVALVGSLTNMGASFGATYTSAAYTVGAGSNRAALIFLSNTNTSGANSFQTLAWGTSTVANGKIVAAATGAGGTQTDARIFYVLEANLQSGSPIVATFLAGGESAEIIVGTVSGVDQVTPINTTASDSNVSTAQTGTLPKSITIGTGGLAFGFLAANYNASNSVTTWSSGWTNLLDAAVFTDSHTSVADATAATTVQATWTTAVFYGMAAASFNAATTSNFTLTAAAGSYVITGEPVSLGQVLQAGSGSYAINGQAVTLSTNSQNDYVLIAGAGTYDISGFQSVSGFQVEAGTGTYALMGQFAALTGPAGQRKYNVSSGGVSRRTNLPSTTIGVGGAAVERDPAVSKSLP